VNGTPPPPGFDKSTLATAEQLESLPKISLEALELLKRCIETHHTAAIDYTDAAGRRSTIRIRPAYIRLNSANHMVVWGIPTNAEHWEELRFDRIDGVEDTGDVFKPTW
jgi:predicted DNA-binding transcriptional regulator YafY